MIKNGVDMAITNHLRIVVAVLALAAALLMLVATDKPAEATFPGQNGRIAFHSNWNPPDNTNPEGDYEIFTMEPDGSDIHQLTYNGATDGHPNFSPDGKKITFMSDRDGGNPEIYTMNADGSNQTRITDNPVVDTDPAFSPDGEQIVFQGDEYDNGGEILAMNADGSGTPTNLSENASYDTDPAVSPDGKVAFATLRDAYYDDNFEIYTMNADGSNQTNISNNPAWDSLPNVSPDGQKIAFHSNRDGAFEIYVMNSDGSNQTRLTYQGGGVPTFSPSGEQIAFTSTRDGTLEIYVMNSDGSNQTRITNLGASTGSPDWQPLDTTAPKVTSVDPDGTKVVARDSTVKANFSEAVQASTLSSETVQLFSGNSKKQVKATLNKTSTSVTLTPSQRLDANSTYKAVVGTGVKDLADNPLDQDQDPSNGNQPKQWTFTTGAR